MDPSSPSIIALPPDRQAVFDALCFMQAPLSITRLGELLGSRRTVRGNAFSGPELRRLLGDLHQAGLAGSTAQGQWMVPARLAAPRFAALLQDTAVRQAWWLAWQRLMQFASTWSLELFSNDAMVGALRVVVLAGGTPEAFDRLCKLSRSASPEHPSLLAAAFLHPFEEALWARIDPELRYRLLKSLLNHLGGDNQDAVLPLWQWLQRQSLPQAHALHDVLRLRLAEHCLLAGDTA